MVTPVFMNDKDELCYGEAQETAIELRNGTSPFRLTKGSARHGRASTIWRW
jgi:hypothetical protein